MNYSSSRILGKRKAFTLIELLVVIAIIAVLVTLSAGGVFKVLSYQKQAATAKTVDQVNSAIERVLKNIRTRSHTDYPTTPIKSLLTSIGSNLQGLNMIGIREPNRRDELVYVDLQIAKSFPLRFSDISASKIPFIFTPPITFPSNLIVNFRFTAFNPDGTINNFNSNAINKEFNLDTSAKVIPAIVQASKDIIGTPPIEIQNSACLLMALEANPDGLKGEFLGAAVKTDSASKARYISTADGQPICFQLKYLDSQASGSKSVVGTVTVELIVP